MMGWGDYLSRFAFFVVMMGLSGLASIAAQ
jgi:hypothetical protein